MFRISLSIQAVAPRFLEQGKDVLQQSQVGGLVAQESGTTLRTSFVFP